MAAGIDDRERSIGQLGAWTEERSSMADELNIGIALNVEDENGEAFLAYINDVGARILGGKPDELIGREPLLDIAPSTYEPLGRVRDQVSRDRTSPLLTEATVYGLDGSPIPVEAGFARGTYQGRPAVICVFLDIRDRKAAQRSRRHRRQRLERLVEQLPVGLYQASLEGDLLEANQAMAHLLGYDGPGELLRVDLSTRFVDPTDWDAWANAIEEQGVVQGFEAQARRADGRRIWLRQSARAVRDDRGHVLYYEGVAEDVTDRKEAEEELRRHAIELARSNAELEQFAYVASHDLQEPLRMVASYVQLLARRYEGELDEAADEYIHFAVEGAQRMSSMLRAILAYAGVDQGDRTFEPVDLEDALEGALDALDSTIRGTGAEITHDPLPELVGDPPQLTQLFQNLISNGIKFSKDGQAPRVHVGAQEEGDRWHLTVEDQGIGIASEHQEKVFAVFQRLNPRGRYPGTGIGLSICKKIVERHGGRIWVTSQDGQGTTVHVVLPKDPPDVPEPPSLALDPAELPTLHPRPPSPDEDTGDPA